MEAYVKEHKVLVADDSIHPAGIELLKTAASLKTLPAHPPQEDLVGAVGDVDAILARTAMISASVIAAAPQLKIVSRHGVGVDYVDVAACTRHGVLVTITGDANSEAVSERAFGFLLAAARKIPAADNSIKSGQWERGQFIGFEIYRKVLGIVGLGRIGSRVARHARGFDMQVIACDPYIDPEVARKLDVTLVDLETLLLRADFITLHVPLTPETRHMIGQAELALMKPSAILINTARGAIVDEQALHRALITSEIAAAALDVFEQEPLPPNYPLAGLDNVICSPHCAGQSEEALERVAVRAAENILCVLRGASPDPSLVVNPEVLDGTPRFVRRDDDP
jgi:D-3-phosphoglycerate dehydrogenase